MVEQHVEDFVGAGAGGDVQAAGAEGVGGAVEEVAGGGGRGGGEDFGEEIGVVAAAGFED